MQLQKDVIVFALALPQCGKQIAASEWKPQLRRSMAETPKPASRQNRQVPAMPYRFDAFISRLDAASKAPPPSRLVGDQNRSRGDQRDSDPVRRAQALTKKNDAKYRDKNNA